MARITEYSGGVAVIPHDRIKEAAQLLAEYENTGLTPERITELNDFEKTQCAELLKKMAGFIRCDECDYIAADKSSGIDWCRLAKGLDGDLKPGSGCSRGRRKN